MTWLYKDKEVKELPKDCEAFVYLITNTTNGMMYVGKKLAKFKTTKKPLKGRKNKRRGTKESDWKTYWGSSERLIADVEKHGEEQFTREILGVYTFASRKYLYDYGKIKKHRTVEGLTDL